PTRPFDPHGGEAPFTKDPHPVEQQIGGGRNGIDHHHHYRQTTAAVKRRERVRHPKGRSAEAENLKVNRFLSLERFPMPGEGEQVGSYKVEGNEQRSR